MKNPIAVLATASLLILPAHCALVGYWSADDGAGTVLTNNEGNSALDGALRAGANWTADAGGHTGMAGDYALDLSGVVDSSVDVFGLSTTFTEVTITGWINPDVTPQAWTGIFGSRSGGPNQIGFGFRNATGNLTYTWNGNSNTTWDWDSGLNVPLNEWSFVALRITPTEATINLGTAGGGLASATNAIAHTTEAGGNWAMGIDDCCGNARNLDGQLDDIAIWDQALTDPQIEALFAGGSPLSVLSQTLGGITLAPSLPNRLGPEDLHLIASAPIGTAAGLLEAQDTNGGAVPSGGVTFSLTPGFGDNALFAIGGPEGLHLVTNVASLTPGGAASFSVEVRVADGQGTFDQVFTITVGADSELDGLWDDWEIQVAGGVGLLSAGTDHEPDGLTSEEEFLLGTDPLVADTDGDGLDDGAEISAGTDPFIADSDGDGLLDGEEVTSVPPTNPLSSDTDGDGFSDLEEREAGTDPTDANSTPVLLLGYWPADEGSGVLVANATGDANLDGDLQNGLWGPGHTGGAGDFAFELNGTNTSKVRVNPTGKNFSRITITGWVNGAPAGDWTALVQARAGGEQAIGMGIRGNSGELTYTWNNNNAATYNFVSGLAIPQNEWTFVALTVDPEEASLYVGTTGVGATLNSATNVLAHLVQPNLINHWNFGIDECCGDLRNFDGFMDDISIWNGVLTAEQIESLWDGSRNPGNLFGPGEPFNLNVVHDSAANELILSWESEPGKLYNLRSETDPSSAVPKDWPIYNALQDLAATPPLNTMILPMPADPFRLFAVEEFNAPPVILLSDDFESGVGGWTTGSEALAGTEWELGAPDLVGPFFANSGANCFGTGIAADYTADTIIWLRSPVIDLTSAIPGTVSYFQYVDTEDFVDIGRVTIIDASDNSELAVLADNVQGFPGDWERVTRALPAEALGKNVKLQFRFVADDITHFSGWYIDDVMVTLP